MKHVITIQAFILIHTHKTWEDIEINFRRELC